MYERNGIFVRDSGCEDGGRSMGITEDLLEKASMLYPISGENVYTGISLIMSCLGELHKMNDVQTLQSDLC